MTKRRTIKIGLKEKGAYIGFPSFIANPSQVYLSKNTILQGYHKILNHTGKFIMKEYCVTSLNLVVVTGNHIPTVGIPASVLAPSHINDKETDIVVEEDVWIGINVTLLAGAHIGRGAIVGACSIVNKEIPPYAIVVGSPAKIIGVKFTLEQVLNHEIKLYPEKMRLSYDNLVQLYEENYLGMKSMGLDSNLSITEQRHLNDIIAKWDFSYLTE